MNHAAFSALKDPACLSVSEALAEGRMRLKAGGIDKPFFEASLLLAGAMGRAKLLTMTSSPLSPESFSEYLDRVKRRVSGVPAAYITGFKEFWGLDFTVSPAVLVPRPETETLVEAALDILAGLEAPSLFDLCTGCGAVAIALKHERPGLEVWAADISEEALEIAGQNAVRLVGENAVRFFQGDLFDALPVNGAPLFSLITANAPYIPSDLIQGLAPEVRAEPHIALDGGADGLDIIRSLVSSAPDHLAAGGFLLLEADPRQMDAISLLLEGRGFLDICGRKDLAGNDRVIQGHLP